MNREVLEYSIIAKLKEVLGDEWGYVKAHSLAMDLFSKACGMSRGETTWAITQSLKIGNYD